jgi:hypothetical protein
MSTSPSSTARTTTSSSRSSTRSRRGSSLSVGQIAPPLRGVLRRHKNVHVELAEVTGFDLERRTVVAARPGGTELAFAYDSLIVAPGATTSFFGHQELVEHALPMKTIDDALNLRRRIFAAFELAESAPSEAERRRWLTFDGDMRLIDQSEPHLRRGARFRVESVRPAAVVAGGGAGARRLTVAPDGTGLHAVSAPVRRKRWLRVLRAGQPTSRADLPRLRADSRRDRAHRRRGSRGPPARPRSLATCRAGRVPRPTP